MLKKLITSWVKHTFEFSFLEKNCQNGSNPASRSHMRPKPPQRRLLKITCSKSFLSHRFSIAARRIFFLNKLRKVKISSVFAKELLCTHFFRTSTKRSVFTYYLSCTRVCTQRYLLVFSICSVFLEALARKWFFKNKVWDIDYSINHGYVYWLQSYLFLMAEYIWGERALKLNETFLEIGKIPATWR